MKGLLMDVLALLGQRKQQRTGNALDTLATAARDAVADRSIDVGAVDAALHELHEPVEFFKQLCDVAEKRRVAGLALEKLGAATGKQRKLADAIAAETARHEEAYKAFVSRVRSLEAEKDAVDRVVADANKARELLLQPANVLGSARPRYEEAMGERDAATSEVEARRRELKQQQHRVREADRWIEDVRRRYEREIQPATVFARPKQSDKELAEIEPHELDKKRAERAIAELVPQVREAEERLDRAERAVVAIELMILKQ
jgi:vacuolar-type H+-ATPase subunit I/STV1